MVVAHLPLGSRSTARPWNWAPRTTPLPASVANQAIDAEGNVMLSFRPAAHDTTIQGTWDGPESFDAR
ncbi:hypothetical protein [Rhodococcus sp. UFZ-B548]|uniref:hypothetical protein n=1 Tax=Rhodococcus sp. UFZ-B548 TaxID=2742212 RepID=UPI0015F586F7|nr:hypothetical protein [Rhodococcus sp. UFZ-B548]